MARLGLDCERGAPAWLQQLLLGGSTTLGCWHLIDFFLYGIMERRLACLGNALHLDTGHQTAWTGFGDCFW